MRLETAGAKTRWILAAASAVAVSGLVVLLFGVSRGPTPATSPARTKPAIEFTERAAKSALDDEATLLDPTPLFLPTKWNAAQVKVEAPEPSGTFQSFRFPAKPGFAEADLKLGRSEAGNGASNILINSRLWTSIDLPDPVAVAPRSTEALMPGAPGAFSLGFGRAEMKLAALRPRGATVEITNAGTGENALPDQTLAQLQELAAEAQLPLGRPWQTMEFVAVVDAAGLAAPLVLSVHSGVEEIDVYFRNFLVRTLRIGERLAPGFYRISVGP